MPYIQQDAGDIPEPYKLSSVTELEFEGYADGEYMHVTVAIPNEDWERFKANIIAA
ncbi:hypothetical protein [Nonomuraea jabiensis]|uniref:hypothetical protein n=1 Tax=Nonomuraea jabiensis TaxID=882448 RepID=UPI003D70AB69